MKSQQISGNTLLFIGLVLILLSTIYGIGFVGCRGLQNTLAIEAPSEALDWTLFAAGGAFLIGILTCSAGQTLYLKGIKEVPSSQ